MQTSTAVWAAIAMMTVGLAGCTGGELDMLVTPSADPVTEPFAFKATGPSYDHYSWDFGDGTRAEGKEVDHLFGFTNGDIIVQLTAHNEGEEDAGVRIARTVDLGGGRNTNPEGALVTNTYWIDPGEVFTVDGGATTDADGDPILYRWTCERVGDLIPPDTSHAPHEGLGGVPFGVDDWASLEPTLAPTGKDYGSDLCESLDPTGNRPWSAEDSAIQGTITEGGFYAIEMLVRDPKGTPWTGRLNMYVADPDRLKPNETYSLVLDGTFHAGRGGDFQSVYENGIPVTDDQEIPPPSSVGGEQTFDRIEKNFFVEMPSLTGTIDFSYGGGTSDQGSAAQYEIVTASSRSTVFGVKSESHELSKDTLTSNLDGTPREYIVIFTVTQGSNIEFDFDMQMEHDIDPLNWYERF